MRNVSAVILVALSTLFIARPTSGYDLATHRLLTESAVQASTVSSVLRDDLALPAGMVTVLQGQRLIDLIGEGAVDEDRFTRVLNHFHNPLTAPWANAGLNGSFRGQSSVLWQQNPAQAASTVFTPLPLPSGGGEWSWQVTRQRFLIALTAASPTARDAALADVFRGFGHVMHLIQDASVPADVRNDADPPLANPDSYEKWTTSKVGDVKGFLALIGVPRRPHPLSSRRPPIAQLPFPSPA